MPDKTRVKPVRNGQPLHREPERRQAGPAHLAEPIGDLEEMQQELQLLREQNRRLEAALEASEERFRTLTRHLPVAVFHSDAAGSCVGDSEGWQAPAQAVGFELEDCERIYRLLHEAAQAGRELTAEFAVARGSDQPLWVAAKTVALRNEAGHITGHLATVANITDRKRAEAALKESEERYRLLSEHASDLIFRQTADGQFLYLSPACRSLTGYDPEELLGRCQFDLVAPQEDVDVRHYYRSLRADQSAAAITYRLRHRAGHYVWVEARGRAVEQAGAGETEIVGVARDISARRRTEEQLQQLQAEMAHFSRLTTMGELASSLAHELNQPLTAVATYARACMRLLHAGESERQELLRVLEQINAQAERAGEVIRRLRAFLSRGRPQRALVRVNDLVQEALTLLEAELRRRGIQVTLQLADHLPLVHADRIQIEQVLVNLTTNAMDAMQETSAGRRELVFRTRALPDAVEVAVRDRGMGIPPSVAAHLFEPFQTTKPQGMGLGLAISRSLIQAHGGRLGGSSNPGCGATFFFTLPVPLYENEEKSHGLPG